MSHVSQEQVSLESLNLAYIGKMNHGIENWDFSYLSFLLVFPLFVQLSEYTCVSYSGTVKATVFK